ncbi:MAG: HD family hydrolase [Pseudomonadota bacterium]
MLSGRRLNLLDPSPLDIEIKDIAHGLARVARWNGQTEGEFPFSVAQHSLLVETIFARLAPAASPSDTDLLAALLHDAPEYVVGDLISPFKAAIGEDYKVVETRLAEAVNLRFSIPPDTTGARAARIKTADRAAAFLEATAIAGFSDAEAREYFGAPLAAVDGLEHYFESWPTRLAEENFLKRFSALDSTGL